MLGNGDELKRDAIPIVAPSKPPRSDSFRKHHTVNQEESGNYEKPPNDQQRSEKSEPHNEVSMTTASEEAATSVAGEVEKKESLDQRGANEGGVPAIKLSDSLGSVPDGSIEASNKSQGVENSFPVVHESEAPAKAIPNDHLPSNTVDETKDHSDDHAQGGEVQVDSQEKGAQNQDNRQDRDATRVHDEKPSDTEVQNHTEAQVHNDVRDREETQTQDMTPNRSEMKSIKEEPESTKPIAATAITTTTTLMENSTDKTTANQINKSHSNSTKPKESESKPNASVIEEQQPTRKSSFGTSKSFRAEDSLFEIALLLGKLASCVLSSLRHLCFS